jgi:hypothetical protein
VEREYWPPIPDFISIGSIMRIQEHHFQIHRGHQLLELEVARLKIDLRSSKDTKDENNDRVDEEGELRTTKEAGCKRNSMHEYLLEVKQNSVLILCGSVEVLTQFSLVVTLLFELHPFPEAFKRSS